ncbi:DUF1997 domain-containing protein [Myxacorys almedinensis]|uniref:DUF1997 domain-containing protein n=1 Tax=Myxacorys almedinensis A TaxID=2690445 RepID=A0A8J8CHT3_9CYAN|nr:DUF1997 domain-containing protein [Myxacorys almedinensis]NDJ17014.1 DUF1997 domain-containing protein [Myxacorys almedinensis A]
MDIRFTACQAVELIVPEQPIHIANYLSQPQRVVNALAASSSIKRLADDRYRLEMKPLTFMAFSLKPVVELQVWADDAARVNVHSNNCELQGIEYINERFMLNLEGQLYSTQKHGTTYLQGKADLVVEVDLPPALALTPRSLIEAAGNRLLASVLNGFKQRLLRQLLSDYQAWVTSQLQANSVKTTSAPISAKFS